MIVYGVDFTSAPSRRKPITCAQCSFDGTALRFRRLHAFESLDAFEAALQAPGTWIAGMDFPFGQARRFVVDAGWPRSWPAYVAQVGAMSRERFREALEAYKADRPAGDKEHRRLCDAPAKSISPQKLYGVPVALMFFEGAPRLLRAGVRSPGLVEGDARRTVVEAYPGVRARALIGRRSYKSDDRARQSDDQRAARLDILRALRTGDRHGFDVAAPDALCDDPTGDRLDALLCAVQAAWAWTRRDADWGLPAAFDPLEGCIVDPDVHEALSRQAAGAPGTAPLAAE